MGKDLKGKELGKGICQRKDGLYSARCTQHGQSFGSYFKTVKEAKSWLKQLDKAPKILKAVTENLTFIVLKNVYGIPCERDMFYDRRRKFYFVLSGMR